MATTITANGINFPDGSAGSPSIGGTDTNTGLFTGSDIVGFATGGSERLRIDASGNINIANDSGKLQFGTSADLKLYHDGTNSILKNETGDLYIQCTGGTSDDIIMEATDNIFLKVSGSEAGIYINGDAGVELYHDNVKKFETRGNGTLVTGTVLAGSSTPAAENSTYVFQAVGASQAYISAYASDTGTNLNSHGMHFGQDINRGYITQREDKDIYFYTNNAHRLTLANDGHLLPSSNNTYNLGASSLRWSNVYTNDLHLSNEGGANDVDSTWGSFTIQEGAEDLFLINRRNGKKYKFNLTEVS